jgi:hypothetical protein
VILCVPQRLRPYLESGCAKLTLPAAATDKGDPMPMRQVRQMTAALMDARADSGAVMSHDRMRSRLTRDAPTDAPQNRRVARPRTIHGAKGPNAPMLQMRTTCAP